MVAGLLCCVGSASRFVAWEGLVERNRGQALLSQHGATLLRIAVRSDRDSGCLGSLVRERLVGEGCPVHKVGRAEQSVGLLAAYTSTTYTMLFKSGAVNLFAERDLMGEIDKGRPLSLKELRQWEAGRDLIAEIAEGVDQLLSGKFEAPTRVVEVSEAVHARRMSGLSQAEFASRIGVSVRTYQEWEQGRRSPTGPARVLLGLIAKRPELISKLNN